MDQASIHEQARQVARALSRIVAADEGELEGRLVNLLTTYPPDAPVTMNEAFQALFNISLDALLGHPSGTVRKAS